MMVGMGLPVGSATAGVAVAAVELAAAGAMVRRAGVCAVGWRHAGVGWGGASKRRAAVPV